MHVERQRIRSFMTNGKSASGRSPVVLEGLHGMMVSIGE
jgi:hypothetical protein